MTVGDILAVRGSNFISRGILAATGDTVSHVGLIIGVEPTIVIEALLHVKTRALAVSIAEAERAYILHDTTLSNQERITIVHTALQFSAAGYNYGDILLQGLDALTHSIWFTSHLALGLTRDPICSFLVAASYHAVGRDFGRIPMKSVTPANIYKFALAHAMYTIERLR